MLMPDLSVLATGLGQAVAGERLAEPDEHVWWCGSTEMRACGAACPLHHHLSPRCPALQIALIRTMRWAVEAVGRGGLPWAPQPGAAACLPA
jgi:hypothetical protein